VNTYLHTVASVGFLFTLNVMYVLYTDSLPYKSIEVTHLLLNGLQFGKKACWQSESAGSSINRETARRVGGCGLAGDGRPTGPGMRLARPNITNALNQRTRVRIWAILSGVIRGSTQTLQ